MDNQELLPFYIKRREESKEEVATSTGCEDGFCSLKPAYLNLSQVIVKLTELKQKYGGDIEVVELDYSVGDDPMVLAIKPAVVSHPYNQDKFVLIFD